MATPTRLRHEFRAGGGRHHLGNRRASGYPCSPTAWEPPISKPTFLEIARRAGVGTATVERVLNGRGGVRPATVEKVVAAARSLDYPRRLPEAHRGVIRIEVILVRPDATFFARLSRAFERIAATLDRSIAVHRTFLDEANPAAIAKRILEPDPRRAALILAAPDHPQVSAALRKLEAENIPTVQIVTQISGTRSAYVGIDNRQAGRLAGYLLGRLLGADRPRKVAMFAGSLSYRGHQEREMGFRHVLGEEFPNLTIVELREMLDDRERAYAEASSLLDRHGDLAGIYNIGAGNQGIARALKERKRERSIVFLGHELTEGTKQYLLDGTMDGVIDQNPRVEAREALNLLAHGVRGLPYEAHPPRLHLILKENIPEV